MSAQPAPLTRASLGAGGLGPALRRHASGLSGGALLVALVVSDLLVQPALADVTQLGLLLSTALPLILLSYGETLPILLRGIDLSVGGTMVIANVLTASWLGGYEGGAIWHLPLIVAFGALLGAGNGIIVGYARINPFVTTLSSWAIFSGLALLIQSQDGGGVPTSLTNLANGEFLGLRNSYWALAIVCASWLWLRSTPLGTKIYAVGSDEDRARLNGIDAAKVNVVVYMLSALMATLAGVYLAAATATGEPTVGDPYLLQAITAVVLGGTSLLGGRGGVGLTIAGCLSLVVLNDLVLGLDLETWVSVAAASGLLLIVISARAYLENRNVEEVI